MVPHKVAKTSTAIVTIMGIFTEIFRLNFANVNILLLTMMIFTLGFVKNSIFTLAKFNMKIPLKMPMMVTIAILAVATLGYTTHK